MENPYNNEQPYQPVPPQEPIPPTPSLYQGNNGFATASLVMGILSLVFLCCAPFLLFILSSLGILFSCLSKGERARSGAAKAGLALSASTLAIAGAFLIFFCSVFLFSPEGSSFLRDYIHILTDDNNSPDYYEDFDEFQLPPEFFQQPETDNGGNFI
jgi:hypothetical protein